MKGFKCMGLFVFGLLSVDVMIAETTNMRSD